MWVIFLIGIPYLTAVAYLVTRGQNMAVRAGKETLAVRQGAQAGIGATWGRSSAQEIVDAKALLDAGTVTPEEFDLLKAEVLRRIQSH